jgi:hypothetical protein
MCVFICANPKVREWLDMPLARAYRQTLQLCPKYSNSIPLAAGEKQDGVLSPTSEGVELDELAQRRVMKRSAWLQAYCRYLTQVSEHGIRGVDVSKSTREWHKAFETIANTWGRILSLVGLRW